MQMAQRISPSMSIGPMSAPYVVVPLVALAQEINVSQPGSEPDPAHQVPEDMRLFDEALTDKDGECLCYICLQSARRTAWHGLMTCQYAAVYVPCCNAEIIVRLAGGPMPAGKRKRHYWNPANRAGRSFTTEHVWTFSMFQDKVREQK